MTEYPSDSQPKLDVAAIREILAGYALANKVIETQRQAILAQMSRAEAVAIWRDLMRGCNQRPEMHRNLDRLDLWQAEGLITVRRALDLMAATNKAP